MIIKSVTGVGYGDEGKGLMTDYFCNELREQGNRVLNIKINGGSQAGHTVCRLDNNGYKHWVFKQYGSGTFAGADTLLNNTFIVNFEQLLLERKKLREIYGEEKRVYVHRGSSVTLPVDIWINRTIEENRTKRHGSCGVGIYETFHRGELSKRGNIDTITVGSIINKIIVEGIETSVEYLIKESKRYLSIRLEERGIADEKLINQYDKEKIIEIIERDTRKVVESICEIGKIGDIEFISSIDEVIDKYGYTAVVFEGAQGLELDQFNTRNFPHLTPSNTGLMNIWDSIKNNKTLQNTKVTNCFVTRSYKTKHGGGIFIEQKEEVQGQFGLYDRTNAPNQYQGILRYGELNYGRMRRLIEDEYEKVGAGIEFEKALAITHLDQTNEQLLLNSGYINYKDMQYDEYDKVYCSFGEKGKDVIEYK